MIQQLVDRQKLSKYLNHHYLSVNIVFNVIFNISFHNKTIIKLN